MLKFMDIKQLSDMPLIGIGVVVVALALGYYLIKQRRVESKKASSSEPDSTS